MKLYVFNKQDGSQSADFYKTEITEDILWTGENWEQFEKETGLSQDEIGGIVNENGKLLFRIEKKAQSEKLKKPIASGKDLVQFLESKFVDSALVERIGLQQALLPVKATLETSTCNPLKKKDFKEILQIVETQLPKEQFELLNSLSLGWADSVRFIK